MRTNPCPFLLFQESKRLDHEAAMARAMEAAKSEAEERMAREMDVAVPQPPPPGSCWVLLQPSPAPSLCRWRRRNG